MNLEHMCQQIKENYHRLKDEKKALFFLRYQFELLAWKRQKLKLGAIAFEIKEVLFDKTLLWEEIEIRYIRQDTSIDDEQKLENILERLGWKWDAKNVIAITVVILGGLSYLIALLRIQYYKKLPTIAFRSEHLDEILKFGIDSSFSTVDIGSLGTLLKNSYWLVDFIFEFCVYFNVIF